jgi:hypothetical protein
VNKTPRTNERTYPADCLGKTLVVNAEWAQELERENAALREQIDDWENAVLHARDNRSNEQHCTCVAPLIGKLKQLERKNAALRAEAVETCAIASVWVTVWGDKFSDASLLRFAELEEQILGRAKP